jgi:hypothetical protein
MTNESFFSLAIAGVLALFFGFVLLFGGYRFFLFLLPVWGFFFGFGLGAQTVQAIFGDAFLSTVTSWVVGFIVAIMFATLAYLFYVAAVALLAAGLGYGLGVGVLEAIGVNFGPIVWLVGVVLAVVLTAVVLALNVQKWVIIIASALLGAEVIVGTFLFLFGGLPPAQLLQNPVRVALQHSPIWMIVFVVLAVLGVAAQLQSSRGTRLATYNRFELADPAPAGRSTTYEQWR